MPFGLSVDVKPRVAGKLATDTRADARPTPGSRPLHGEPASKSPTHYSVGGLRLIWRGCV